MAFFALLFKVFGLYFKRMLRVCFLWVPLGVGIERWSLFERLLDAGLREALAELYVTVGPILRKIIWLLPLLVFQYFIAAGVSAETRDDARALVERVRQKMGQRDKTHGQAEAAWLAGLQTLPFRADGRLKTLIGKTEKNRLLRIDITSDAYDLKPLIAKSVSAFGSECRSVPGSFLEFVWCANPNIIIGAQRVKSVKVLGGQAIGQPVYIHPAKLSSKTWVNRLTFYARAPVDGGPLTMKTIWNIRGFPLVRVSVTDERTREDLIAKRRAEVQAEREAAEARRIAAEARRQRELAEQHRREAEARAEAERQRQLAEEHRQAELKTRARPESAPALDPEREPLDLSGKWRLKDVGNIIRIDHDVKTGRLLRQSVKFSRDHIKDEGRTHYTLTYRIDPKTPDRFTGEDIVHMTKKYRSACPEHPGAVRVPVTWIVIDAYTLISRQKIVHYNAEDDDPCSVRHGDEWVIREWVKLSSWGQWWYTDFYSFKFLISLLFVTALVIGAWRLFRRGEAALRAAQAEAQKEEAELINENIKNLSNKLGV